MKAEAKKVEAINKADEDGAKRLKRVISVYKVYFEVEVFVNKQRKRKRKSAKK